MSAVVRCRTRASGPAPRLRHAYQSRRARRPRDSRPGLRRSSRSHTNHKNTPGAHEKAAKTHGKARKTQTARGDGNTRCAQPCPERLLHFRARAAHIHPLDTPPSCRNVASRSLLHERGKIATAFTPKAKNALPPVLLFCGASAILISGLAGRTDCFEPSTFFHNRV